MKTIFLAGALLMFGFIISCKDAATTGTGENDRNAKDLASNRKVYKAIETGDKSTLDSFIAKNATDHQGPNGADIRGGDSIVHMLTEMHNHVRDLKFDVIADAASGDYLFSLVHITGTANDASMGMTAGTKLDEKGVDVVKVKDGQMVEHWGFVDANEMMKHMKEMQAGDKMDKTAEKIDNNMDNKMMDTMKNK